MSGKFKIETVQTEKKINFLTNVDPEFVSLVRHGANRTPFRVIKEEGANAMMFVQSILVPKSVNLDDIVSKDELKWLSGAKLSNKEEFDDIVKFQQMPVTKFEKNLNMIKLDSSGVYAIVGDLVNKEDSKDALTFDLKTLSDHIAISCSPAGKLKKASKMMEVSGSPADAPIAEVERKPYVVSFKEMFEVELDNFLSVVRGTLNQSGVTPEKRKKTVMSALDGFKNFLTVALDAVKTAKKENSEFTELNNKLEKIHNEIIHGGNKEMTKDEVKAIVIETLDEKAKEVTSKEEGALKTQQEQDKVKKAETEMMSLNATIKELVDKVDGVVKKQEELGNQIVSIPAAIVPGGKTTIEDERPKSVFSGLISGRKR